MSSKGVEQLRAGYDAFARQDIPAVLAVFDEQIEWVVPDSLPFGGTYHGHDGVLQFFGQLPQHWQELSVEPEEFIDAGDTIVVLVHGTGTGAGGRLEDHEVHLWRMRDDKAISFREFSDTARALQALGSPVGVTA